MISRTMFNPIAPVSRRVINICLIYENYTHSAREKVTEAKLEVDKVETRLKNEGKTEEEIAQNPEYLALKQDLNDKQQTFDNAYGMGSKTKRAVDAVTAALQGLAAKDVG